MFMTTGLLKHLRARFRGDLEASCYSKLITR
jgi:hypothetical protein